MNNEKARNLGFQFRELNEWLPMIILDILEEKWEQIMQNPPILFICRGFFYLFIKQIKF